MITTKPSINAGSAGRSLPQQFANDRTVDRLGGFIRQRILSEGGRGSQGGSLRFGKRCLFQEGYRAFTGENVGIVDVDRVEYFPMLNRGAVGNATEELAEYSL